MTTIPLWLVVVIDIAIFIGGIYIGTKNPNIFKGWLK